MTEFQAPAPRSYSFGSGFEALRTKRGSLVALGSTVMATNASVQVVGVMTVITVIGRIMPRLTFRGVHS